MRSVRHKVDLKHTQWGSLQPDLGHNASLSVECSFINFIKK